MSKKRTIKKLRRKLTELANSIERFPILVSGCFTYSGIKFHVNKEGLIYQDTDIPEYICEICALNEEKLKQHLKQVEMSFLYGTKTMDINEV